MSDHTAGDRLGGAPTHSRPGDGKPNRVVRWPGVAASALVGLFVGFPVRGVALWLASAFLPGTSPAPCASGTVSCAFAIFPTAIGETFELGLLDLFFCAALGLLGVVSILVGGVYLKRPRRPTVGASPPTTALLHERKSLGRLGYGLISLGTSLLVPAALLVGSIFIFIARS